MSICFTSQLADYELSNLSSYKNWIKRIIDDEGFKIGEIQYIFVSIDEIIQLNSNYLNHVYPTDVITFDNSYLDTVSGDIFICNEIVRENARTHSGSHFIHELNRVIVHGLLHLLGYSDNTFETIKVMRNKEDFYLKYLD